MHEMNFAKINVLLLAIFLSTLPASAAAEPSSESPWTIRCETVSSHQHNSCIMYQEILLKKVSPAKELIKSFSEKYNSNMQELMKSIAY